jgi:hypothetical protein
MPTEPLTEDEAFNRLCTVWQYDANIVRAYYNFCKTLDRIEIALCQVRGLGYLEALPRGAQNLLNRRTKLRAALSEVSGNEARIRDSVMNIKTNFPHDSALP